MEGTRQKGTLPRLSAMEKCRRGPLFSLGACVELSFSEGKFPSALLQSSVSFCFPCLFLNPPKCCSVPVGLWKQDYLLWSGCKCVPRWHKYSQSDLIWSLSPLIPCATENKKKPPSFHSQCKSEQILQRWQSHPPPYIYLSVSRPPLFFRGENDWASLLYLYSGGCTSPSRHPASRCWWDIFPCRGYSGDSLEHYA